MALRRDALASHGLDLGKGNYREPNLLCLLYTVRNDTVHEDGVLQGSAVSRSLRLAYARELRSRANHRLGRGLVQNELDCARTKSIVEWRSAATDTVDGMLCQNPFHAILHVKSNLQRPGEVRDKGSAVQAKDTCLPQSDHPHWGRPDPRHLVQQRRLRLEKDTPCSWSRYMVSRIHLCSLLGNPYTVPVGLMRLHSETLRKGFCNLAHRALDGERDRSTA